MNGWCILQVQLMRDNIFNTEALMQFRLDAARNNLLTYDTIFGVLALCFSFGGMMAGFFGFTSRHPLFFHHVCCPCIC